MDSSVVPSWYHERDGFAHGNGSAFGDPSGAGFRRTVTHNLGHDLIQPGSTGPRRSEDAGRIERSATFGAKVRPANPRVLHHGSSGVGLVGPADRVAL
jgi:hypothetical protein